MRAKLPSGMAALAVAMMLAVGPASAAVGTGADVARAPAPAANADTGDIVRLAQRYRSRGYVPAPLPPAYYRGNSAHPIHAWQMDVPCCPPRDAVDGGFHRNRTRPDLPVSAVLGGSTADRQRAGSVLMLSRRWRASRLQKVQKQLSVSGCE